MKIGVDIDETVEKPYNHQFYGLGQGWLRNKHNGFNLLPRLGPFNLS